MILTSMPDLPPRPLTTANAAFRRSFYARWGRENAIVCGRSLDAEYEVFAQRLSIKAAWGGSERYYLPEREVAVDDDRWLVLNEGRAYGSRIHARRPVHSFALFFRPDVAGDVAGSHAATLQRALDDPEPRPGAVSFSEHLRPHGRDAVSCRLRAMHARVTSGEGDQNWLDEQAVLLLADLLGSRSTLDDALAGRRRSLAAETARRLQRAADHIDSHFHEPLTLDDMARVACLSRYHFVRHFRRQFGQPPYAYLLRKRARAARRLLDAGEHDRETVALACGFGSRSALSRALQRMGIYVGN